MAKVREPFAIFKSLVALTLIILCLIAAQWPSTGCEVIEETQKDRNAEPRFVFPSFRVSAIRLVFKGPASLRPYSVIDAVRFVSTAA